MNCREDEGRGPWSYAPDGEPSRFNEPIQPMTLGNMRAPMA
jgi:hypothetical protein